MPRSGNLFRLTICYVLLLSACSVHAWGNDSLDIRRGIAYCSYSYSCALESDPYKYNFEYDGISSVPGPWFPSLGGGISAESLSRMKPCAIELRPRISGRPNQPSWTGGRPPAGFNNNGWGTYTRQDPRDCLAAVGDLGVGIGYFSDTEMTLPGYYAGMSVGVYVDIFVNNREYGYLYRTCSTGKEQWKYCDSPPVVPNYRCSIDLPPTIDMGVIGLTTGPSEYSEQIQIQCSGQTVPNTVVLKIENEKTAMGDGVLTSSLCNEQGANCSSSVATGFNSLVVIKFIASGFLSPGLKSGNVIVTSSYN